MAPRTGAAVKKVNICPDCLHEIVLLNNDKEFSYDMHRQEQFHKNSRGKQILKPKVELKKKDMQYWFISINHLYKLVHDLEILADNELNQQENNKKVILAVTNIFLNIYDGNFDVKPFGSRITGLSTKQSSDLDLFIVTGDNDENTLANNEALGKYYLKKAADYIRKEAKSNWTDIREVLSCRTPILKLTHVETNIKCDITLQNCFGNVNTALMITYMIHIPILKQTILVLREWASECKFTHNHNNLHNYALSMLVLFYFQQKNYAPSVFELNFDCPQPALQVDGYDCIDYSLVKYDWPFTGNLKLEQVLHGFFSFYSSFDYDSLVICPLLGKPVKKSLFLGKKNKLPTEMHAYVKKLKNRGEIFYINEKSMNIQDPIDLSHNLTKSASQDFLWDFMDTCEASRRAIEKL